MCSHQPIFPFFIASIQPSTVSPFMHSCSRPIPFSKRYLSTYFNLCNISPVYIIFVTALLLHSQYLLSSTSFSPSVGTDADSFIWWPWYRLVWLNIISSGRTRKANHLAEPLNQIISKTSENEHTHAHIYTHVRTTVIMHQYI